MICTEIYFLAMKRPDIPSWFFLLTINRQPNRLNIL